MDLKTAINTLERVLILLKDNPKITDDSGMIKSVEVLEEIKCLYSRNYKTPIRTKEINYGIWNLLPWYCSSSI